MEKLNFKLIKDNKTIINENNITCISQNNKILFTISGIKYSYFTNIFIKETKEEIIKLDFNKKLCTITLKEYNNSLNLNLLNVFIENNNKYIKIEYKIETEDNINNIIRIEYV